MMKHFAHPGDRKSNCSEDHTLYPGSGIGPGEINRAEERQDEGKKSGTNATRDRCEKNCRNKKYEGYGTTEDAMQGQANEKHYGNCPYRK
jgi:hypothetical protein